MVLNEIIEQAGRQSRASDQNGTVKIQKNYKCCFLSSKKAVVVFCS